MESASNPDKTNLDVQTSWQSNDHPYDATQKCPHDMNANSQNNGYDVDTTDSVLPLTTGANIVAEVNNFIAEVEQATPVPNNTQCYLHVLNLSTSIDKFITKLNQKYGNGNRRPGKWRQNTIVKDVNTEK